MLGSGLRRFGPIFFLLLSSASMFSQAGVASLSVLVTDPSGAIVVGAHVTETNTGTEGSHTTVTDRAGYYTFVGLPVGQYRISASQAGFREEQVTLMLDPSEQGRQDFHLKVVGGTTIVDVTAEGAEISRDDASIGTVIDNQTIVGTPLYQRNWDDLIRLIPGVQMQRFTQQSGSSVSGSTGLFVIHGIGDEQNDYILDGIDNNTFSENLQELSASAARPSVDVINEFKLISNAYTAAYGRSPGAQVDVSTKGGTNQYHGLLFEYLRNKVFDSNDYFSHQEGIAKPELNQNPFGGYVGAPIVKNKLFGFFDYEGTRIAQGVNRISTVPLAKAAPKGLETGCRFGTLNAGKLNQRADRDNVAGLIFYKHPVNGRRVGPVGNISLYQHTVVFTKAVKVRCLRAAKIYLHGCKNVFYAYTKLAGLIIVYL